MWFLRVHDSSWRERCCGEIGVKTTENIRSPYILMVFAYFLACLMSFAVSSATGLGVLLMATLFPVMVNGNFTWGSSCNLCIANFDYPFSNIGRRGAFC